jgi:hypothetical protein
VLAWVAYTGGVLTAYLRPIAPRALPSATSVTTAG